MGAKRNKYVVGTHISERKFRDLVKFFCDDYLAAETANFTGISRPTVNKYYDALRKFIADLSEVNANESPTMPTEQSPGFLERFGFGSKDGVSVFSFLKLDGSVSTQLMEKLTMPEWMTELWDRTEHERDALAKNAETLRANAETLRKEFADYWDQQYERLSHTDSFKRGRVALEEIEAFWGAAKTRLSRFRGLKEEKFFLYIKECEFRYNMRNSDMYQFLLSALRETPLRFAEA